VAEVGHPLERASAGKRAAPLANPDKGIFFSLEGAKSVTPILQERNGYLRSPGNRLVQISDNCESHPHRS
jgi:hypothetical protein